MHRFVLFALAIIWLTSCSGSSNLIPTAPSAVTAAQVPAPAAPPATSQAVMVMGMPLSWELADGCVVQKPALSLKVVSGKEPVIRNFIPGELQLRWLDTSRATERKVTCGSFFWEEKTTEYYIAATFKEQGGEWRYCGWDSLTREQFITKFITKVPTPEQLASGCK